MMEITVLPYRKDDKDRWDKFVWDSVNGTIFHTRKFLTYHPEDRFKDSSVVFFKRGKIFSVFPAVVGNWNGKRTLHSHRGASYGGFVCKEGLSIADSYSLVEGLINYAEKENIERIIITLPPVIYDRRLSNYIDFSLIKHGFIYLKREVSSILFLEKNIDDNVKKFKPTNRTAFRKAIKLGVKVKETEDFETFFGILKKNLKIRHNVQPTHTLAELLKIKRLFPDKIHLFGAYYQEEMIAGVVMFDCNSDVSLAFYISHNEEKQQYRGVNLLFYYITKWAIEKEFKYIDFGIFTVNMEPNFGLGRFKESFGASGVLRDTFVLNL